jgi:hypothetical protein
LVIVHRDELEEELAQGPAHLEPDAGGRGYLILGTVDRKVWQRGLTGSGTQLDHLFKHTAEFKKCYDLQCEPGG